MSEKNPNPGKAGDRMPGGKPKALLCEQWEALLVDALDGTLGATESAAFYAHRDTCLACAQLLEESKRGSEWLHFLEAEPQVPADLISKILAKTSGAEDTQPAMIPAGVPLAIPAVGGWAGGWLPMMEKHAAQSRWIMTAATAFFSLAFMLNITLNMTGVKLTSFRMADLKPTTLASGLKSESYVARKSVMRYYDNVRFFYELESRVRELRRDAEPVTPAASGSTVPGANGESKPGEQKPAAKHTGGSAQVPVPEHEAEPVRRPEPVMASFEHERFSGVFAESQRVRLQVICKQTNGLSQMNRLQTDTTNRATTERDMTNNDRTNVHNKRSEGGLA